MKLLGALEYNEIVQAPQAYFSDPQIRSRSVATDAFGLPEVFSGNFAYTYRFLGNPDIAVRCFHRTVPELFERYRAITEFLKQHMSEFFLEFDFQEDGLQLPSGPLPVLRMQWVNGPTLFGLIKSNPGANMLAQLREQLLQFSLEQQSRSYAHGDVQPRNILVENARLKFVDYDGMFVPDTEKFGSADLGHPDYQSPLRRPEHFGAWLDRFSLISLDLSLQALAYVPGLLTEFDGGENLVLGRRDFYRPADSPALKRLEAIPALRSSVALFRMLCAQQCSHLPTLEEFQANKSAHIKTRPLDKVEDRREVYQPQAKVVEGRKFIVNDYPLGAEVEVVGQVTKLLENNSDVVLSLSETMEFTVVIPSLVYRAWTKRIPVSAGTLVSLTGTIERRRQRWRSENHLVIRATKDLEILPDQKWLEFRLGLTEMKQNYINGIAISGPEFVRRRTTPLVTTLADLQAKATRAALQQISVGAHQKASPSSVRKMLFVIVTVLILLIVFFQSH